MRRPLLLDLFCGAGGAAMGYHRAGFDVVGVDIVPQPRYPFPFIQYDAMTYPLDGVDVIHASPPCHDHTPLRHLPTVGVDGTEWMLHATLERLRNSGALWVVENVGGANLPPDIWHAVLCGSAFGLDVRRHRRFASNVALLVPSCRHSSQTPRFRSLDSRRRGALSRVVGVHGNGNYRGEGELRKAAMQIDWMTIAEISQAIPPAYTEHVGAQLKEAL